MLLVLSVPRGRNDPSKRWR